MYFPIEKVTAMIYLSRLQVFLPYLNDFFEESSRRQACESSTPEYSSEERPSRQSLLRFLVSSARRRVFGALRGEPESVWVERSNGAHLLTVSW